MDHTRGRISRRTFVLSGAALAAGAGLSLTARATGSSPDLVLCDRRFLGRLTPDQHFARVIAFDADLTRAWVDHLQPMWAKGPAIVAGIATPAALHCLEELARGERHRIVERTVMPGAKAVRFRIEPLRARGFA